MSLSLSHCGRGVQHSGHDLVVARAPAEIAGQPVAHLGFARVGVPVEQGLRRHQEAGRADPALERRAREERLLQRVEMLSGGQALDGLDGPSAHLAPQHQAGADEPPVQHHAAGAAVTGGAAFLAAGQVHGVAQHVEQRLLRLAEEFHRIAVHPRLYVVLGHQLVLARSSAIRAARRASTPATSMRNSVVPRLSSIGRQAARAAAESRCCAASSSRLPMMACAAAGTSSTRAATAPSDTRAAVTVPAPSTVKLTPAPTTAMSISVRGMKRRYASLERGGRGGSRKETTISPLRRASLRGPSITSSTGRSRLPSGPASVATAPAAMRAGTLSAAGEPLQRLPPSVARPCTWVEPMRFAASTTPGHTCFNRGCSLSSAPVTAAPIRQPPFSSVIARVSGIRLMSTIRSGSTTSARIWTRRSVPPARTRVSPVAPASRVTAPCSVSGAS